MTDETLPPERRTAAGMIGAAAAGVDRMSRTDEQGVHPMSRILFGWVESRNSGKMILRGALLLSAILILLDFVIERHEKVAMAATPAFYALWGFGAFTFVVLMGWPLGRLLRRGEDYYGDLSGPPADIDPAIADQLNAGAPKAFEGEK